MSLEPDILNDHDAATRRASVRKGFVWLVVAFACLIVGGMIVSPSSELQKYLLEHGTAVEGIVERSSPGFRGSSSAAISYYVDGKRYCACVTDSVGDVGDSVTVYVDPTDPEIYTLEDVLPQGAAGFYGTLVAIVGSFGAAFLGFRQFV